MEEEKEELVFESEGDGGVVRGREEGRHSIEGG